MSDNEAGPAGGGAAGGASADDLSLPKATIAKLVTGERTNSRARSACSKNVAGNKRRRDFGTGSSFVCFLAPVAPHLPPCLRGSFPPPFPAALTSEYLSNDLTAGKDVKEFLGDCCKGEATRSHPDF